MADAMAVGVIKQIEAQLNKIQKSDGFLTDAGDEVIRGFLAHAIKADKKKTPFIVLQPDSEAVETRGTTQGKVTLSLTLFVVEKVDQVDRLQAAVSDLRRALTTLEFEKGTAIGVSQTFAPAAYNPNPESNYALAALPVSVSFVENYCGD